MKTAHLLELIRSLRGSSAQHSLMGVMNHCHTNGGIRLLRSNILEPPCLLETILTRLDCVQEIIETPELNLALEVSMLLSVLQQCETFSLSYVKFIDLTQFKNKHVLNYTHRFPVVL
jgi:DNA mismatch repair ATPase MutS